jgi:23S rRNA pseudouridine1911/1915/1917 synthase
LGDTAYGGPQTLSGVDVPRQMLHSRELSFNHPVTGEKMTFTAPLPNDFSYILKQLDVSLNGLKG